MERQISEQSFRLFAADDLETVAALWRRSWISAYPHVPDPPSVEDWVMRLEEAVSKGWEIILCQRGRVVQALMIIDPKAGHVSQLFVDVPYQRQGIGSAMLDYMRRRFPEGYTLNVIVDNADAIRFYEKYGLTRGKPSISPITFRQRVEYFWKQPGTASHRRETNAAA